MPKTVYEEKHNHAPDNTKDSDDAPFFPKLRLGKHDEAKDESGKDRIQHCDDNAPEEKLIFADVNLLHKTVLELRRGTFLPCEARDDRVPVNGLPKGLDI